MLASDEDSDRLSELSFSLASDIVELVVLTNDEPFLQTLRDALVGSRRLWHVPSPDKVSDLLVAGEVGILVVDVQSLDGVPGAFVQDIKRQFPDLVVVVAGNREAETSLAGLISLGSVYRFIHKPMSPGRAKLFADAAIKKHEEQRRLRQPSTLRTLPLRERRTLAWGLAAVALAGLAGWAALRQGDEATPVRSAGAGRALATESPLLTRAAVALAANRLVAPSGENALELYLQELARNPFNAPARAGLAEVRERLVAHAENALLEERLDEAARDIETARRSGVDGGRIAFLNTELGKTRDRVRSSAQTRLKLQAGVTTAPGPATVVAAE